MQATTGRPAAPEVATAVDKELVGLTEGNHTFLSQNKPAKTLVFTMFMFMCLQATTGRPVAPEVAAAVDKELASLSRQKPRLPWKAGSAAAAGRSSGNSTKQQQKPAGQQGKQQLPRSARKKMKS
jgi:hypothetical protein